MISWANFRGDGSGVYSSDIVAGDEDDLISAQAHRYESSGRRCLVRWFWEMDGSKKAEWAQDPETWIAAWQHIVSIFREEDADNVEFVWCPNASAFDSDEGAEWYPGDGWVDWLCADGYNWAPGQDGAEWVIARPDLRELVHDWGDGKDIPMMIGESGVQERNPGEKPAWFLEYSRRTQNTTARDQGTGLLRLRHHLRLVGRLDIRIARCFRRDVTGPVARCGTRRGGGGGGGVTRTRSSPISTDPSSRPTSSG